MIARLAVQIMSVSVLSSGQINLVSWKNVSAHDTNWLSTLSRLYDGDNKPDTSGFVLCVWFKCWLTIFCHVWSGSRFLLVTLPIALVLMYQRVAQAVASNGKISRPRFQIRIQPELSIAPSKKK